MDAATVLPVPASALAGVRADNPPWARPALAVIAALAAILFVWGLDASGWGNTYYSAAAQAAAQSWSSFFFGSLDAGDFITLDKPPASVWLIGLSVRLFGLSSWSVLLPQALAGLASVVVLYLVVRRTFGTAAGLVAALVLALTPIAVVMFRYNNPDALLTLLFVLSAATILRAVETGGTRWLVATGVLVGVAFLTKYLQGLMVFPALAATYLLAAPGSVRRRVDQLALLGAVTAVAGGWWVAIVEAIPTDARPYIGGSETDSVVELILGYDGLGRIFGAFGSLAAGPDGGAPGGGFGGTAGLFRMFNDEWVGQIGWLLPAALVALAAGLWIRRHAERTDRGLAAYMLFGLWLIVHVAVFSLSSGIIHPYYAVAMAPAIAALVAAGLSDWWRLLGTSRATDVVAGGAVIATGLLAWQILGRTPTFAPWLGPLALATALVAGFALVFVGRLRSRPRFALAAVALALVAGLAGPAAYAVESANGVYGGGDPSAGPDMLGASGGRLPDDGGPPDGAPGGASGPGIGPPGGSADRPFGDDGVPAPGDDGVPAPGDDMAGPVGSAGLAEAVLDYLVAHRGSETWLVAVQGAGTAGPIQLETGIPVMAIGGFSGSDPAPTAEELASYVAQGELRFVFLGGGFGPRSGAGDVSSWVSANCSAVTLDGGASGLYDCAAAG